MSKKLLVVKNIYKEYNKRIIPVNDISMSFESTKFYAIKGRSGAGKSTFLNLLGLIDQPDRGSIIINDEDVSDFNEKKKAACREKYIGFVFQSSYLNPDFTAVENVMIPMLLNRDVVSARKTAEELLIKFELYDRKDHRPKKLSGGEQQRIAIARAFANNPDIIIADEPTGNLDEENETKVFEMFKEYASKGACIICVSHSETIEKYADEILYYKKGGLLNAND